MKNHPLALAFLKITGVGRHVPPASTSKMRRDPPAPGLCPPVSYHPQTPGGTHKFGAVKTAIKT